MKRCPRCHARFADTESACPRDGSPLVEDAASTPEAEAGLPLESPSVATGFGRIEASEPSGEIVWAPLTGDDLSIGKDAENGLRLDDSAVSRRHAVLRYRQGEWFILDEGSRNGVYVNGRRVEPGGQRIVPGDAVLIGRSHLRLILDPSTDSFAAPPFVGDREPMEILPGVPSSSAGPRRPDPLVLDGRYELEAEIGRDPTGTLYRARRIHLGDQVTVRILSPELSQDPVALERFRRQARVAVRIQHPNSVRVYDFGHLPDGGEYMVEEPLSGKTLRDLILRERGLTLARVASLLNQICGAVHTANLNGIVLRDIRPETIFIEQADDGRDVVKVGNSGLAKVDTTISGGGTMAAAARTHGTPEYASPEQLLGQSLDSRSDVYSLGVILFELLTGVVPFHSPDPDVVARMHLHTPVPDLTEFGRPDLDEGVATVISRALAKAPSRRQPTALELAAELQAVSGATGGLLGTMVGKVSKSSAIAPPVVTQRAVDDSALPSVIPDLAPKKGGAFNPVVMALMAEAVLSRISSGLLKTLVPLYALLVFGLDITEVMLLGLVQNVVPLLMRSWFGSLADRYGKKRVFMISLLIRTAVGLLYAAATLPMFFLINAIRGVADSARVPSASAMIADNTDEKHIAQAYSWYTTAKSTSGGIGEAIAAFLVVYLIVFMVGGRTVTANVAVLEELTTRGAPAEEFLKSTSDVAPDGTIPGDKAHPLPRHVLRVERREVKLKDVSLKNLPKVVNGTILHRALVAIFICSTVLSSISLVLVATCIKESPRVRTGEKRSKDLKSEHSIGQVALPEAPARQPNVWAFALLGTALTAPAYMVTGEFFTALAVKTGVTAGDFGWIKIIAETIIPLVFGPFFGWVADRKGASRVIAFRSAANLLTSLFFWITPWFQGTAFLCLMMGLARAIDEVGKAAFKPTWGAITAKVSSFNLANRSRTMGILEGGVDASDLVFPVFAGVLLDHISLGVLMGVRALLALVSEAYGHFLMKEYKIS